jgi:DNA polymerase-3 subunit epsilon
LLQWLKHARRYWYASRCDYPAMVKLLSAPFAPSATLFEDAKLLSVDLETTSLDVSQGEIASIGWVAIDHGAIHLASAKHLLIKVREGVGQSAVFHQLRDEELDAADSVRAVMDDFIEAAAGRVLVFHNAALDMAFLNDICQKLYGAPLLSPVIDTLQLEKKKLLHRYGKIQAGELRLFGCRLRYGLPDYPAHDALVDALATAELLLAVVAHRGLRVHLRELY